MAPSSKHPPKADTQSPAPGLSLQWRTWGPWVSIVLLVGGLRIYSEAQWGDGASLGRGNLPAGVVERRLGEKDKFATDALGALPQVDLPSVGPVPSLGPAVSVESERTLDVRLDVRMSRAPASAPSAPRSPGGLAWGRSKSQVFRIEPSGSLQKLEPKPSLPLQVEVVRE